MDAGFEKKIFVLWIGAVVQKERSPHKGINAIVPRSKTDLSGSFPGSGKPHGRASCRWAGIS